MNDKPHPSRFKIVAALGATQTLAWASSYYLAAILADPIARELGMTSTAVFAPFSAALVIAALLGPRVGRTIDRFGGREALAAVIQVERNVLAHQPATGLWKSSSETSFYLSNRPVRAEQAADAVRKHWGIENGSHYVRDVTLREDASRIGANPGIFARCRSFAYNILRFNQSETLAQDRYAAALGGFNALASMRLCQQN